MKSNSKKENINAKKKYVFFTDPDIIVQRAEIPAQQDYINKQSSKDATSNVPVQFDLKSLGSLSYHSVQPYPFTFISAVKRKLALNDGSEVHSKTYESNNENEVKPAILESDSKQNLHQVVQTMDFIRPLKVPDLKISAKKLDFSNRENCASKELISQKCETPAKEFIHDRGEKSTKSFERVQRRLDFSTSDISSTINSEVEPLKVPNISISSNLSKKKEYVRENSREKENRSKRIRKDESSFSNQEETIQDFPKRSKSPRHISRKDISNNVNENTLGMKLKNDRLSFHIPKESDFAPTKPKPKNFATSTAKKINDKKHRSINTRSLKSRDFSYNETLSERSSELSGITMKESRNIFENFDSKHKNDSHTLKQIDDQICTFLSENRQVKHQTTCQTQGKTGNIFFKEQNKKSEKVKPSTSKMDSKMYIISSKEFEDIESVTDSDISLRSQSPIIVSTQQIKNKDSEKIAQSVGKSNKVTEDLKYADDSLTQSTNVNTKKEETSFTESVATTIQQSSNSNESNLNNSILSSALLDPRRISFRDENHSQQKEFCDLITPDMNLMPRSKRKREFMQNSNMEAEFKYSKHNMNKTETEKPENSSLLHPTALHMQFKAELHLLDSFNESLRQVIDVEKCLYDVKHNQENELPLQDSQSNDQVKSYFSKVTDERNTNDMEHSDEINISHKHVVIDKVLEFPTQKVHHSTSQTVANEFDNVNKVIKPVVKAVEVQTQTMNDMATQTDIRSTRRNVQNRCSEICGTSYEQEFVGDNEIPHLSFDSVEQFGDLDQIEEISLSSKLRTMSEISLHETTSSIRTETGTEISISTRDIICSFNKYLDLEIAQLLQDEKQRYDKIEMLFKSREKTLIDRTKKLVKLEEQKRALKDTGQDSRVSSVKKKQRALLLKLQQEKDEMNRLKELHKIASQERKLMLQKQRNMFNPEISTKNILTKLKRSADSQSPRKLSGPMKGYDIRSNSSMSSLLDSDKSQHDRSQIEARMQISENDLHFSKIDLPKSNKFTNFVEESNASPDKSDEPIQSNKFSNFVEESNASLDKSDEPIQSNSKFPNFVEESNASPESASIDKSDKPIQGKKFLNFVEKSNVSLDKSDEPIQSNISQEKYLHKAQKDGNISKYEIKSRKFEEKMPKVDIIKLKSHQHSVDPRLIPNHSSMSIPRKYLFEKEKSSEVELSQQNSNKSISEHIKSDSETLIEESSKKSKPSQITDDHFQTVVSPKKFLKTVATNSEILSEEVSSVGQDTILKTSKSSQVSEDILQMYSKSSKRNSKSIPTDMSKNTQYSSESKSNFKRRSSKYQKSKSSSSIDTENILGSKSNFQMSEEPVKHHNKRTKMEKEFIQEDKNNETAITDKHTKEKNLKSLTDRADDYDSEENVFCQKMFDKNINSYENFLCNQDNNEHNFDETSTKPQIGNFAIFHHNSGEIDRNYTESLIVSSQDHNLISEKLEQVLNAREAALTSRKNCVKNWMAWHTKLKAEEDHVTQMEQTALKLITAASSALLHQDTTISSDTSDIEGRIELLTEKLAKKRIEMSRLKREARKQTKQKLRALEANLLNQIKKYDATIYEMRKKLESKKGFSKDSDKLAIESKSLADFKIPEIPLKRLQDMFKCSDLFRSRSESDLFSTKRLLLANDSMKNINLLQDETIETDRNDSEEVLKSSKSTRMLEQLSFAEMSMANYSAPQVFDKNVSEQIESDKFASASMSLVSGGRLDKNTSCETGRDEIENKQNVSETIRTEDNISKSETDIVTQSEAKLSAKHDATIQSDLKEYKSDFDTFSEQSRAKTISSQFEDNKLQHSEYSYISSRKSNDVQNSNTEINTEFTNDNIDFSKKMDFLRLNNQILNEDISSLENELKILSEMMSRFNKKSNKETKYESQSDEKSTSKDISEILSASDKNNEISDVEIIKENKNANIELYQEKSNSDISQYMTNDTKLKSVTNFSDNKSITKEVDNVISVMMPESKMSLSKSNNQEIDYKARSKKILNEIEKSIISEHIKGTKGDISRSEMLIENLNNNLNLYKKDEKISSDTSAGIRSLSETYSKTMQSEECTNAMEFETVHSEENVDINIEENLVNSRNLKNRQLLESSKSLSLLSEKSNSSEKDESSNQCTDLNHSPIINDVLAIDTHLENKSDSSLKYVLQDDSKQTIVTEYINELLKRQISPQLSNLTKINNNSIDYMKNTVNDGKYKNINDVYPTSEVESVKLILSECKEFSDSNKSEVSIDKLISKEVSQKFVQEPKQNASDENALNISKQKIDENESQTQEILINETFDKDDRIASDSFGIHSICENSQNQTSNLLNDDSSMLLNSKDIFQRINDSKNQINAISDVEDVENMSLFIPESESSNIAIYGPKLDETIMVSHFENSYDKAKDISDIINKNNDREQYEEETVHSIETDDFQKAIYDSVIKILDKVERSIEDNSIKEKIENHANNIANKNEIKVTVEEKEKSIFSIQNKCLEENKDEIINEKNITLNIESDRNINEKIIINEIDTETAINLDVHTEIKDDENTYFSESRGIIITELEPGSVESGSLSELEINAKIELAEEELIEISKSDNKEETQEKTVQELKSLEPIIEQDSSDGEQLDNLVEITETVLDVIEKEIKYSTDFPSESESISHNKTNIQSIKIQKDEIQYEITPPVIINDIKTVENIEAVSLHASQNIADKTFDILKDPEYEDISEESLEVSEIFDKSEIQKSALSQKSSSILERYEAIPKSGDVLKILDEIAQKFSSSSENDTDQFKNNKYILENNKKSQTEISDTDSVASSKTDDKAIDKNEQSLIDNLENQQPEAVTQEEENQLLKIVISPNEIAEKEKQEQDVLSESSEGRDTPKGISEIEMDSPRDLNDSRLNIDVLNDDLLTNSNMENQNTDSKNAFHTTPIVATSEKDIEVMIDKLKASLKQPGMEVADWEAKLLRIEQLQIELEIKKLEAEEVSFYVREIPNKPPPPYTPPGSGARISTSLGSSSSPPAVIPSNIEELTAFTEKATAIIFEAKETGEDIMSLEAPFEICELTKENDETVKKDRRIYNTFLFDLCKETIAEVYQAEYEKPGPSWTKPNVKTKPTMKIPKTIQELNAYVNKEVATLFGFKTKLQRENMVMRWSRKRRDRVDELLAREAQAEEDEWTKFHHDELAVKNGLTVTILDTLLMETVNVVKVAYAKKRKVMV